MKKTFQFILPEVEIFTTQTKAFLPKLPDSQLQRYEGEGIQLVEEYMDYHSVIFYRIQVHVQQPTQLTVRTHTCDYHLLYNLHSPETIVLEHRSSQSQALLPSEHDSYIYIPKGKIRTDLFPGDYLVYGVLVDIGYIRPEIYQANHFLSEFRKAHLRDKNCLYQSAIWPIKEKTRYQISHIEERFFKYHKDNEAMAVKMLYDLFDIAIYKNFQFHEKINPNQLLAERAERMIRDQVMQTFSSCSIQTIADQMQVDISTLDKLYKAVYGETPRQTWNKLIVQKAKDLLLAGYAVKEVSNYCGYGQQQNFSTFFKKHTGICPSQYK
ncbi:helix-turn-helix domain-containing protein [Sphingobacterium sp. NGMCC 1.201703]|uniref:helix-turn-helix domain-containing protein n=1 Tax=Sphingobacterium sp. NGMCC 1.201703 TaxID=3388657 RepID=UPI0039FC4992